MNIGERIYQLRTEKSLSQGDLADRLEVSRQSVSKWENNTAVPDLDKLIKICDIFEISLDELTGREKPKEKTANKLEEFKNSMTKTQFTGCILIGVAILSLLIPLGVFFTFPIALCAMICLLVKKNAWYWCIWAVFIPLLFVSYWGMMSGILRIIEIAFLVIMAIATYKAFNNTDIVISRSKSIIILICCIVYDVLFVVKYLLTLCGGWDEIVYFHSTETVMATTSISLIAYVFINMVLTAGVGATLIGITLSIKNLKRR